MLKFLKSLFEDQEQEPEIEEFPKDLSEWCTETETGLKKRADKQISAVSKKISAKIETTEEHIVKLEQAELRNKNIPKRALQIMSGNREAYIKKTRDFLARIDTDFDEAMEALSIFDKDLEALQKGNAKSNMVLNEFFSDETKHISLDIKDIVTYMDEVRSILKDTGVLGMPTVWASVNAYDDKVRLSAELDLEFERLEQDLTDEEKTIEQTKGKIDEIKSGAEYKSFEAQDKERDEISKQLTELEKSLSVHFASLETALKKYGRISVNEKLILAYQSGALSALVNDAELQILDILMSLKSSIENNKIELKEKKRQKALLAIKDLDAKFFVQIQDKYKALKTKKRALDEKMTKSRVIQDYDEQDYKLKHSEKKLSMLKTALEARKRAAHKIDLDELIENIKTVVQKELGIEFTSPQEKN